MDESVPGPYLVNLKLEHYLLYAHDQIHFDDAMV
jgi:hypothetical protein